jgi:energy-coupling factor transporter ATP-binding protein EcfA2
MVKMEADTLKNSNYTHAFPSIFSCCDWTLIGEKNWPAHLINGQEIHIRVDQDHRTSPTIHHFFFEQQNQRNNNGNIGLALGYPLLFLPQQGTVQALPVFIWPLRLSPATRDHQVWRVKSAPDSRPILNPMLVDQFSPKSETPDPSKYLSIEDTYDELAAQLAADIISVEDKNWLPFPDLSTLKAQESASLLYPSVVFGLFPSYFPTSAHLHQISLPPLGKADITWRHHISHQDLDPSQQSALNHFYESELTLVTGAAGTGKTHLVKSLIVNALSNQKKTLVISNRPNTIQKIQKDLEQLGISHLSYWLRNPHSDANILPKLLKSPLKPKRIWPNEQALRHWLRKADEFQQYKDRQDLAFRVARTPIFGPMDWAQTLGLYLKTTERASRALLGIQLKAQDFKLNVEEFTHISEQLDRGQQLFQQVGSIRHPLKRLHPEIFSRLSKEEAIQFVRSKMDFFLHRLEQLQQEHINLINRYERQLKAYFEGFYKKQIEQITQIEHQIGNNATAYGNDFLLTSSTSLKLYAPFSRRIKTIRDEKEKIIQQTQQLMESSPEMPELVYPELPASISKLKQLRHWLQDLHRQLEDWHEQIPHLLQDHLRRLNYQTTYEQLGMKPDILNLEAALDQTVEALNETRLLAEQQSQPMLTLPKRQQRIESLIEYLETIQINLRDFSVFYDWQHFWLTQDNRIQEIIQAIIRSKSEHWQPTFEAWYLQQLLESKQSTHLPEYTYPPAEQIERLKALQINLAEQINSQWEEKRQESARQLRRTIDPKMGESGRNYLRRLIAQNGKALTQSIPLLMSTAEQAVDLLQETEQPFFDLIIFESAQFIAAQQGQFLQQFGKQSFIIGNNQFVFGDDEDDFLEAKLTAGIPGFELVYFHQYYPGHLWQLMRGQNITEKAVQPFSIRLQPIRGSYKEELGINTDEIYHIMEYLKHREQNERRTYQSLAIVCNTIPQRNFISKAILDIKRSGNEEERNTILQMERNGLRVLHLSELAAYRFEELIYSFTFSANAMESKISPHAAQLNTPAGLRQLNELMSTGKSNLQLVYSLSGDWIRAQAEDSSQIGFFLFANYLLMLEAIRDGKADQQDAINQRISKHFTTALPPTPPTPFYDEIATRLSYFLPDAQMVRNFQEADLRLPLLLRHADYPDQNIAVIADYFVSNHRATQIVWEEEQRRKFARRKIFCIPTYSLSWWQNPDRAAQALANLIVETWEKKK